MGSRARGAAGCGSVAGSRLCLGARPAVGRGGGAGGAVCRPVGRKVRGPWVGQRWWEGGVSGSGGPETCGPSSIGGGSRGLEAGGSAGPWVGQRRWVGGRVDPSGSAGREAGGSVGQ